MISILLAARCNSIFAEGFLMSVWEHAKDLSKVEVVVSLSGKDTRNLPIIKHMQDLGLRVSFVISDKTLGRYGLGQYMNDCAEVALGDVLWHMCDDHRFLTTGFDEIIERACVPLAGSIYSWIPIGMEGIDGFACPMITRKWYQTVGHWAMGHSADSWIGEIRGGLPEERRGKLFDAPNRIEIKDLTIANKDRFGYQLPRPDADVSAEAVDEYLQTKDWPMPYVREGIKRDIDLLLKAIEEEHVDHTQS